MFCACCADDKRFTEVENTPIVPLADLQPLHQRAPDPQELSGLNQEVRKVAEVPQPAELPKEEPKPAVEATRPAKPTSEEEFVVQLEKTSEQSKIGVEVDKLWGRVLITKVKEGLINDYNKRAAQEGLREVKAGHVIAAVNGISETPQKILKTVAADMSLAVTIRVPKEQK
mmetsp:Transcript_45677/g.99261  ORF Transcript_45677/g.99261 Transcript_45677/m.99261 type:complete len:171 (+) Transcript_45677:62-574(+)